jgi:hypothetical protein
VVNDDALLAEAIIEHAWGIIGPYGNIWTPRTFDTPEMCSG